MIGMEKSILNFISGIHKIKKESGMQFLDLCMDFCLVCTLSTPSTVHLTRVAESSLRLHGLAWPFWRGRGEGGVDGMSKVCG